MTSILPRTSPESVGLDPAAVRHLIERLDDLNEVHSLVVVRDGHVVAEAAWAPHTLDRPHQTFSVSKSFTSMAVGLAIDEGLFGLDDSVVELLAPDRPARPSANLAAMRVRHLLTMTTGHAVDTILEIDMASGDLVRKFMHIPVEHEPGTRFVYNTGATYLAGAIVQRLTGGRLLDYLRPRLLEPLGITTATWQQDPDGRDVAGFGLTITTEELAAFGEFCRQRGRWRGRQLVPAAWIDAATARQVSNDPHEWPEWEQGYGFQFWRCRHGAYRADGAFGQFAIVWPEHRMVIAINAGSGDTQAVLDAVWTSFATDRTVRTAAAAGGAVDTSGLRLRPPAGAPTSPREAAVRGVTYRLDTPIEGITSITLSRDEEGGLRLGDGGEQAVPFGYDEWVPGVLPWPGVRPWPDLPAETASAAAWSDESRLTARTVWLGTPFSTTLALRFVDDHLEVALDQNVSFGPTHLGHTVARPRPDLVR